MLNVCDSEGALLVGAREVVPDAPEDFVWPTPSPSIGCNALHCKRCGVAVRSVAGWRLAYGLGAADMARLFELPDWSQAGALLVAEPLERTYVCRCNGMSVSFPRELHAGGVADDNPAPVGWHCGGHPRLALPAVRDGVALVDGTSLGPDEVGSMLRGEVPDPRPSWLGPQPAEWLVRLWFELADRGLAEQLALAVAQFLSPDRAELASALHFFAGIPEAAAEPARASLARISPLPPELAATRAPFPPHEPLERLVKRVARRLGT